MPAEVEAALLAHPAVAEAGVFGRPDPEWGEAVTACVVLRAPLEPAELRAFAARRLAPFKVPKSDRARRRRYPATRRGSCCAASCARTSSGRWSRSSSVKRRTVIAAGSERGVPDPVVDLGRGRVVAGAVDLDAQPGPGEVDLEAVDVDVLARLGKPGAAHQPAGTASRAGSATRRCPLWCSRSASSSTLEPAAPGARAIAARVASRSNSLRTRPRGSRSRAPRRP